MHCHFVIINTFFSLRKFKIIALSVHAQILLPRESILHYFEFFAPLLDTQKTAQQEYLTRQLYIFHSLRQQQALKVKGKVEGTALRFHVLIGAWKCNFPPF